METDLTATEIRVLGCLIEKEMTTPEYYPLSLNGLTNACNQKSNRDPVLELDETDVVKALDKLRFRGMALHASGEGSRVPKYGHNLEAKLYLEPEQLAILCELFVRGPQTLGELRSRCERMRPFADLHAVEAVLDELMELDTPLVTRLPRQPGRKEQRYAHLFAGVPEPAETEAAAPPEAARLKVAEEDERIRRLEEEVAAMKAEFEAFRKQFE
ncbi:MAG: DUF480 domain-containing protein [Desulfuromonas sp.]|nr:MAG: DUF480 domain-containing protein [Desulfuromonas sp.]